MTTDDYTNGALTAACKRYSQHAGSCNKAAMWAAMSAYHVDLVVQVSRLEREVKALKRLTKG